MISNSGLRSVVIQPMCQSHPFSHSSDSFVAAKRNHLDIAGYVILHQRLKKRPVIASMTSHVPVDFSASWRNGSQRVRESNTQWFWFHHTFLAVRGPHCPRDADQSRGQGLVKWTSGSRSSQIPLRLKLCVATTEVEEWKIGESSAKRETVEGKSGGNHGSSPEAVDISGDPQ